MHAQMLQLAVRAVLIAYLYPCAAPLQLLFRTEGLMTLAPPAFGPCRAHTADRHRTL
jgi:hypothetical protein